jgi:hypothetical protein
VWPTATGISAAAAEAAAVVDTATTAVDGCAVDAAPVWQLQNNQTCKHYALVHT